MRCRKLILFCGERCHPGPLALQIRGLSQQRPVWGLVNSCLLHSQAPLLPPTLLSRKVLPSLPRPHYPSSVASELPMWDGVHREQCLFITPPLRSTEL
jgi:hypothetical protein